MTDQILDEFKKRGYIIDTKKIGEGAFASVYKAHRDYAIRISKDGHDDYDNKKAIEHLHKRICSNSYKLPFKNTHILCTESSEKIGDYLVEILQAFDTDLMKYLIYEEQRNNNIIYNDKISFYELSMLNDGVKYIKNFNEVSNSMLNTITTLHDANLAHGDIKPSNILIKLNGNEIKDFAISDFDTLCLGIRNIFTDIFECETSAETPLFSTMEMSNHHRNGKRYDINIKKRSDIYAINLVILMMWHGYIKFLNIFDNNYNSDQFFDGRFKDLSRNTPEAEIKRNDFFNKLRSANERKFNNIITLHGKQLHGETLAYTTRIGYIVETFHIIKNSTDVLERIMSNKSIIFTSNSNQKLLQSGGYYNLKYNKYKKLYNQLKLKIN